MARSGSKNPGARAGTTGVGNAITCDSNLGGQSASIACGQATLINKARKVHCLKVLDSQAGEARVIYGRPFFRATADYETVARMLKDTLVLARDEGTQVFLGLTAVMRSKLSIGERKWFAWAALVSLDSEDAWDVMERVRSGEESAGRPQMPFLDIEEEANDWAARASLQELWAYALACLTQLSPKMRGALWRLVGRKLGP